ncbi:MAG: high frequency lysogenization protein HflD [Pseudomonadales bacterium]|nr:high frequency lysogenization protein HflD [Pseudomonadales bacterium]
MADKDLRSQVIAFAGVLQSVALVDKLAQTGECQQTGYDASIFSIFQQDAENIEAVYGDIPSLYIGLTTYRKLLNPKERLSLRAVFRYCYGLHRIERQLTKNHKLLSTIGNEIELISGQLQDYAVSDPHISEQLSKLYRKTISSIKPPIQVMGNQQILEQSAVQRRVRALLLAGIRSATLWHQVGGRPWRLIITPKKKILDTIDQLLQPVH